MPINLQKQQNVEVTFLVQGGSENIAMVEGHFASRGCRIPRKRPNGSGVYVSGVLSNVDAEDIKGLLADNENIAIA